MNFLRSKRERLKEGWVQELQFKPRVVCLTFLTLMFGKMDPEPKGRSSSAKIRVAIFWKSGMAEMWGVQGRCGRVGPHLEDLVPWINSESLTFSRPQCSWPSAPVSMSFMLPKGWGRYTRSSAHTIGQDTSWQHTVWCDTFICPRFSVALRRAGEEKSQQI